MDPLKTLAGWIAEARAAGAREPEAMALATSGPSVRFVLCKRVLAREVWFFTSYGSRKGDEIAADGRVAAALHWAELGRQVRLEGVASRLDPADSDAYFASRPRGSQLSAAVSPQSAVIDDLAALQAARDALERSLAGAAVPRPAGWGGYRITVDAVELWWARPDRFHERLRFVWEAAAGWRSARLAP